MSKPDEATIKLLDMDEIIRRGLAEDGDHDAALVKIAAIVGDPATPDWRSRTCGECGWGSTSGLSENGATTGILCRRVAFGGSVNESDFGWQNKDAPACPAFVAKVAS